MSTATDIEVRQRRWDAFWRGESNRPLFQAIKPKLGTTPTSKPGSYDSAFGDLDEELDKLLAWYESHEFLGDSIPYYMITFTPDHFAALLGAPVKGDAGYSNWVKPCLDTLDGVEIRFDPDGHWWQRTAQATEKFRDACDGKIIITATHLQGALDCLVAMYGAENLLMDMAMAPELVHEALKQVDTAICEVRQAFARLMDVPTFGSMNRFGMYSRGVIDVPQCDVSCMISQAMFDEFQLPYLAREIATTDASIYHLDGVDAVKHLQSICTIDRLDMIQWMPGAGHYDDDHRELNAKIDSLGKGQIFQPYYNLTDERIIEIWETFKSRKLFFHVPPDQCRRLLAHFGE